MKFKTSQSSFSLFRFLPALLHKNVDRTAQFTTIFYLIFVPKESSLVDEHFLQSFCYPVIQALAHGVTEHDIFALKLKCYTI